jgi:RimJ/RimL family protein N-acetyltransferase
MTLVLKSERLLLRPLAESDLDLGIEILTDPEVMRYVAKTLTREEVAEEMPTFVRRCAAGAIGIWCVTDRASGEKLGTAVLLPLPIEEDDTNWDLVVGDELPDVEIEIGYILKRSAWGKGYATEACARLMRFAFEQTALEELVAITDQENKASQHVLRKCGLVDEGLRPAFAGNYPGFRISRRQWLERSPAPRPGSRASSGRL